MNSFSLGVTEPDWFSTIAAFLCGFFYFTKVKLQVWLVVLLIYLLAGPLANL